MSAHTEERSDRPVGHEESDVDIRAVAWFIAGLALVAVLVHAGLWLLLRYYADRAAAADPRPAPLARPADRVPPEPRLLTDEPAALAALRAEEEAQLRASGPVRGQPGVYRIPIDRAKALVVERGLPARPAAPGALDAATAAALRDSSSGRKPEGDRR
jgi:hypothetical protein